MRKIERLIACLAISLVLIGCQQHRQYNPEEVPPDFSLAFCVEYPNEKSFVADPLKNAAIFIVEPNGLLRAAIGPGCTLQTFPAPTRQLNRDELNELYRLCRDAGLNHNADLLAPDVEPPRYQVVLNAWVKSYSHDASVDNAEMNAIHEKLLGFAEISESDEFRLIGY